VNKWLQCDTNTKEQIRAQVEGRRCFWFYSRRANLCFHRMLVQFLQALKSPVHAVSHTTAQVLGAFGAVDVPKNAWPSLLAALFHNINSADVSDSCKVASLEVRTFRGVVFRACSKPLRPHNVCRPWATCAMPWRSKTWRHRS
jgi:hypothetical protein